MPPKNFSNEITSWRAEGFEPWQEALAEYDKWNRPRVTGRATAVALATMAAGWVWVTFFKGKAVPGFVVMVVIGFGTALWTMRWEWIGRRDAEDLLRRDHEIWVRDRRSSAGR